MTQADLKISHTGQPGAYVGLIKRGNEIVWRCPHKHANRDQDTKHTAARSCASLVLLACTDPDRMQRTINSMRNGAPHFQYAWQSCEWLRNIERHEWALATAKEIRL